MENYSSALWLVFITMTTVGYGDLYAVTPMGRVITFAIAIWGAIILSILFATMARIADLSEKESRATAIISDHKNASLCLSESMEFFHLKRLHNELINTPTGELEGEDQWSTKKIMNMKLKKL